MKWVKQIPKGSEVLVSCDEELNILFKDFEIAKLDNDKVVIYGLSGSEVE